MRNMAKSLITLAILILMGDTIEASRPKFSDQQIIAMTPRYFKRSREAPEFLGVNIYQHPQRGKVFQVDIRANRNQENDALSYSFTAILNLSRYFKRTPKLIVVVIHSNSLSIPPVICTGDVECTTNYFIYKRISYEEWYNKCITFEGP